MPHSTLMLWLHKAGWPKPEPQGAVINDDPAVLKAQSENCSGSSNAQRWRRTF